jgi:hypothetical protein
MDALVPPDPSTRVAAPTPLRRVTEVGDTNTDGQAVTRAAGLMVIAGLAAMAGSLLPWGSVTAWFGTVTVAGTAGNGRLTLAAGAFVAAVGLLALRSWASYHLVVLGLVAACAVVAITGYNAIDLTGLGAHPPALGAVDVGYGLWLTLGAGVTGILGAALLIQRP